MKKKFRITKKIGLLLLVAWIVAAQTCNEMRVDDAVAINDFRKFGVVLTPHVVKINGHILHYVSTGTDTLPLLIFIHGSPGSWEVFKDYLRDSDLLRQYNMISIDRTGFGFSDY